MTITLFSTVIGMIIVSVVFTLSGAIFLAVAKGGIHEATAGIFFLGAIVSGGVAAISRDQRKRASPKNVGETTV
ncbi:hypothetical protein [Methylobacterium sp. ARG-1]|uniref:hypothetical protein n=1 Tax=Methylobacterium sp. ARG-1 TaxID=1692501 RepID=UPI0011875F06|nr:hypothetical protein [Methylobacterium sp. ARG-1]